MKNAIKVEKIPQLTNLVENVVKDVMPLDFIILVLWHIFSRFILLKMHLNTRIFFYTYM